MIRTIDAVGCATPGELVSDGVSTVVRVSAEGLSGWVGWRFAGAEHIAAPLDIARRSDGHDVLLPWCTERVPVFLARRSAADEPLSAGEISTLVVSILRGIVELSERELLRESGGWWLGDHGRPLFVAGTGDEARKESAYVVDLVLAASKDRAVSRVLTAVRDGLMREPDRPSAPRAQLDKWEQELLELAAPRALRAGERTIRANNPPLVVRDHEARPATSRRRSRKASTRSAVMVRIRLGLSTLVAAVALAISRRRLVRPQRDDAVSPSALSGRMTGVTPRDKATYSLSRRRKMAVAGGVAGLVLIGGMLWPTQAPDESSGATVSTKTQKSDRGATSVPMEHLSETPRYGAEDKARASEQRGAKPTSDPLVAAPALLDLIDGCVKTKDNVCTHAVAGGSTGVVGAVSSDQARSSAPEFALVDEYGDIAVIRMSSGEGTDVSERMLVLVRLNDRWLVREIYDVANQPS